MAKGDRLRLKADPKPLCQLRMSYPYQRWVHLVVGRNPYCCNVCGASPLNTIGATLHAHHIKPFADYPELRFDVNNGEILCSQCHRILHSVGVK